MRRNFQFVAGLAAAAIFLACGEAQAQRRRPSEAAVSGTEHFGDKAPPKEALGPASAKPVAGEEDARPGVGEVSKEPPVATKARSVRRDPAEQPKPKP